MILEGSCTFEDKEVEPYTVVHTKKNTPYGPIRAGDDGLLFLDLRETPAEHFPVEEA